MFIVLSKSTFNKIHIKINFVLKKGEASATYHFKTLIPSVAAGAIIGKGGETIASLQKETSARVKMSKSHDFYPGMVFRF